MKPNQTKSILNTSPVCVGRSDRPERSRRIYNILSTLLFYLSILIFIIGFNFTDNPPSGWYQQFMPDIGSRQISDITFLDSLTGFAVTSNVTQNDTGFILKTTSGGDNWNFKFTDLRYFTKVKFINLNTGYVTGGAGNGAKIYKTTNAGDNWLPMNIPGGGQLTFEDISVFNEDTFWVVASNSLVGGVFRTTNGGVSWDRQFSGGSNNPAHIYMYNARIGFIDAGSLRRTTDGGNSWTPIIGAGNFLDMYFVDSLTGWKCNLGDMKKTMDGGLNWVTEVIPNGGNIFDNSVLKISKFSGDTLWSVGGSLIVSGSPPTRGILFRTSNGGNDWLFQLPDTSIHFNKYFHGQFINSKIGWAYQINGIHTITGGDTTWYTGIQQMPNAVPEKFILKQNYPNPFNPRTVIPYSLSSPAHVKIIAYDITGREVQRMVDNFQQAGAYEVDFMGKFTATGVYFYRMTVTGEKSGIVYTDTKKMVLLK